MSGDPTLDTKELREQAATALAIFGEDDGARLNLRAANEIDWLRREIDRMRSDITKEVDRFRGYCAQGIGVDIDNVGGVEDAIIALASTAVGLRIERDTARAELAAVRTMLTLAVDQRDVAQGKLYPKARRSTCMRCGAPPPPGHDIGVDELCGHCAADDMIATPDPKASS